MIKLVILSLLLFSIRLKCDAKHHTMRELVGRLNPDCPDFICHTGTSQDELMTLVHVIAKGSSDCLHYIWDFTGKPSVLLALTPPDTDVKIDWSNMLENKPLAVNFTRKPIYTAIAVINKLWQFNDTKDIGELPIAINASELNGYDMQKFTWTRESFRTSAHTVAVTLAGTNEKYIGNGTIKIKFKCASIQDHDIGLPHLLMSENSTLVDFVLDNITVNENFGSARFATEVILIADESNDGNQSFTLFNRKTLDDEHTPGIFHVVEIASPESHARNNGSYMQYRPVSYTHPERDVSTSTDLHNGPIVNLDDAIKRLNASLAWSYYGDKLDKILAQGFNMSFGQSGDGFYAKSKYNTWTFVMAYGASPNEELSMFVVIVATIGLGLPLLLLFVGGCFICIRRTRNRRR